MGTKIDRLAREHDEAQMTARQARLAVECAQNPSDREYAERFALNAELEEARLRYDLRMARRSAFRSHSCRRRAYA